MWQSVAQLFCPSSQCCVGRGLGLDLIQRSTLAKQIALLPSRAPGTADEIVAALKKACRIGDRLVGRKDVHGARETWPGILPVFVEVKSRCGRILDFPTLGLESRYIFLGNDFILPFLELVVAGVNHVREDKPTLCRLSPLVLVDFPP